MYNTYSFVPFFISYSYFCFLSLEEPWFNSKRGSISLKLVLLVVGMEWVDLDGLVMVTMIALRAQKLKVLAVQ